MQFTYSLFYGLPSEWTRCLKQFGWSKVWFAQAVYSPTVARCLDSFKVPLISQTMESCSENWHTEDQNWPVCRQCFLGLEIFRNGKLIFLHYIENSSTFKWFLVVEFDCHDSRLFQSYYTPQEFSYVFYERKGFIYKIRHQIHQMLWRLNSSLIFKAKRHFTLPLVWIPIFKDVSFATYRHLGVVSWWT